MGVNLVLALLPVALAIGLFRRRRRRTVMWWVALVAFVALLPNAPYVVTDLIHLAPDIHRAPSKKAVVLGLLPLYGVFVLIGLESYAIRLRLARRYLTRSRWRRGAPITQAGLHPAHAVRVPPHPSRAGRRVDRPAAVHQGRLSRRPPPGAIGAAVLSSGGAEHRVEQPGEAHFQVVATQGVIAPRPLLPASHDASLSQHFE